MYEERRNSFSIRDIILQILLIVLFVLMMIWLFPTKNYLEEQKVVDSYGSLYTDYITSMTEAAKSYFTTSKVPTEVGGTVKLTLADMLKEKLVLEIGGNAVCDNKKSYVEVTKMDTDYQLRVELSCEEFKDYVIVTIGCTDFCTDCNEEVTKPSTTKPTQQAATKYTVTFDSNGGTAVSSQTVTKGKTASKPTDPTKEGYTFVEWTLNGAKYDFNTKVNSNITLVASWKANEVTLYQYQKEVKNNASYSEWSNWSDAKVYWGSTNLPYKNTDLKEYTVIATGNGATGETTKSCTTKTTAENVKLDTKKAEIIEVEGKVLVSTYTKYEWKNAQQVASEKPLKMYYRNGVATTEDNADTRYTFVKTQVVDCGNNCSNKIVYVYTQETRVAKTVANYSCEDKHLKTGTGTETKCTRLEYSCEKYGKDYELSGTYCIKYGTKNVETESCKDVAVKKDYVKYQFRTRTLNNAESSSLVYEWSTSNNDAKLIADGYTFNGQTKVK